MIVTKKSLKRTNSSKEYRRTQRYNAFVNIAKPIAVKIVKDQRLVNTTFSNDERIMNALNDMFIQHQNAEDWELCMTEMRYLYTVLHNELCTVQSYDRGRVVKGEYDPDSHNLIPVSSGRFVSYDNAQFARVAESDDDTQEIFDQDMQDMPVDEAQADAFGCFEQACTLALQYLSREERLILVKAPREFVKLSGSLRDDKAAYDRHWEKGVGKLVMRYMSDKDIASIVGMSESSVRVKRNALKHDLVKMMAAEFRNLYKESDCDRQFAYLTKRVAGMAFIPDGRLTNGNKR